MAEPAAELSRLEGYLAAWDKTIRRYDAYYEGEQPIRFLAPAMRREFGERITTLVMNLARIGTDAYEARLDVEGFRYSGDDSRDQGLWDIWQANDGDEQAQQAHLESLALTRSYVTIGVGDSADDAPIISVEHPLQAYVRHDPRTRKRAAGIKRWTEDDGSRWAVLYLPDSTGIYRHGKDGWDLDSPVDEHMLGRVPMVPLVNRPRILRPNGLCEFHDIIPLMDAVNKLATDMMVSAEFHAMPRRYAFGLKEEDFQDANGNPLSTWSAIAGRLWTSEDKDVTVGTFPESDLAVFHNTIKFLVQMAAMTMALPPHYMAFTGENPTSADAIRSSEIQLVKRVERKQAVLGGAWEEVMRLVLRLQTGTWEDKARSLETMWRDPSTPTIAQKADAVMKLASPVNGGRAVLPIEQAREDLGYTPEQRRRMAAMDQASGLDAQLARIVRTPPTATPAAPAPIPMTANANGNPVAS
jgi:hypothetical protein